MPSPLVLHGMSLVHVIRHHSTVPGLGHTVQDELSGTKLLVPVLFLRIWETESFLGLGLLDFCKTRSSLYTLSQLEAATQALASLSILFASALVILRV
jgi:hypothetical protein